MEQPDKLEFDFDGDIVGLDGDLLPLEGWGAADHSILDNLGVGEISSNGQGHATSGHPTDLSFVDQTTQAAVFPSEHYAATPYLDTASIATTADTSHMVSNRSAPERACVSFGHTFLHSHCFSQGPCFERFYLNFVNLLLLSSRYMYYFD